MPRRSWIRAIINKLTFTGKAFEVLMAEMQKIYNPAPEKKKSGWFSWGR